MSPVYESALLRLPLLRGEVLSLDKVNQCARLDVRANHRKSKSLVEDARWRSLAIAIHGHNGSHRRLSSRDDS